MNKIFLKKGREEALMRGHPWVFSGAISRMEGATGTGEIVDVFSHNGVFIGRGYYHLDSQIAVRLLARLPIEIDKNFIRRRIEQAIALRRQILTEEAPAGSGGTNRGAEATNSCRLIHAEGDLLPGLIVDKYGDYLVFQINTAGMERFRDWACSSLQELLSPRMMYDHSDPVMRAQEGLPDSTGPIADASFPDLIEIRENGVRFLVNVKGGQKTGFYLDQRNNRSRMRELAQGKRVLNCFSYTGGFSVYASLGGAAQVTSVESSTDALELCKENLSLNDISLQDHRLVKGDVFDFLRGDDGAYDLIILDPPAFAKRKGQVKGAIRGYKDINLHAMKRVRKGGMILTCSCSQHIDAAHFQTILSYAANDAGRTIQIIGHWGAPIDHPHALNHAEGEYLKAFLLRVVE
jgi:23S rRNA (cytosine1962-C5)-methyltransferase